jgi:hypothetical protein
MSLDDELRDALRRPDVDDGAGDLADVRRRAAVRRRRRRVGTAAGALAAVLGAGAAVAALGGDDPAAVVTDQPTTTAAPAPDVTFPGVGMPARVLVLTQSPGLTGLDDGWPGDGGRLLLLDPATGAIATDLGAYPSQLGAADGLDRGIVDVAVDADRSRAYLAFCCDAEPRGIRTVPTDSTTVVGPDLSDTPLLAPGVAGRPSPTGALLATAETDAGITVRDPDGTALASDTSAYADDLAWSPSGAALVWLAHGEAGARLVQAAVARDGTITRQHEVPVPDGLLWSSPTVRADGQVALVQVDAGVQSLVLVDPATGAESPVQGADGTGPVLRIGYDATGTWLLAVGVHGRLFALDPGGDQTTIATGIVAADW